MPLGFWFDIRGAAGTDCCADKQQYSQSPRRARVSFRRLTDFICECSNISLNRRLSFTDSLNPKPFRPRTADSSASLPRHAGAGWDDKGRSGCGMINVGHPNGAPQIPPLRYPGFPVGLDGVGGLHAPFLKRKAHTWLCLALRDRKSGFAPVGMTNRTGSLIREDRFQRK